MERASRFFACLTLVGISCWAAATLFAAPPASDNPTAAATGTRAASQPAQHRGQSPAPALGYGELVEQGREAFNRGQYELARRLALQALSKRRPGPLRRILAKDSAQKLLSDIAKVQLDKKADADRAWDEQERAEEDGDPFEPEYRSTQASGPQKEAVAVLLRQAQVEMQKGNTTSAYNLAIQAKGFDVSYGPGEQTPDDVLLAIAAYQRRDDLDAPALVNPLAETAGVEPEADGATPPAAEPQTAEPQTPEPQEIQQPLPQPGPAPVATPRWSRAPSAAPDAPSENTPRGQTGTATEHAAELLRQARRAMAQGHFDQTREFAQQAKLQEFAPAATDADTPDVVLHQIDEYHRIVREGRSGFDRDHVARRQHDWLLELAGRLKDQGDLGLASSIAKQALELNVPPAGPGAMTAARMLAQIEQQGVEGAPSQGSPVEHSAYEAPAEQQHPADVNRYQPAPQPPARVTHAAAEPMGSDRPDTRSASEHISQPVSSDAVATDAGAAPRAAPSAAARAAAAQAEVEQSEAQRRYDLGVQAMRRGEHQEAIAHFQAALNLPSLEPQLQQRIQDHLTGLYARTQRREKSAVRQAVHQDPLSEVQGTPDLRAERVEAEATQALIDARRLQAEQPDQALAALRKAQTQLTAAGREQPQLLQLLRRVNERIGEIESYKEQNASALELREQNRATEEQIKREQEKEIAVQKELAELVDQFNQLIDDRRFAEAEKVAEKAAAIAPDEPVTQSLVHEARIRHRYERARDQQQRAEESVLNTLEDAENSRIAPVGDDKPVAYPPTWEDIVNRRQAGLDRYSTRTEAEQEIEKALRRKVSLKYEGTPLLSVLEDLKSQAGINLVIDQQALDDEGVDSTTPVTIDVDGIMLKSALKLILEEVHLIYVIRDEVLKITSEARGRGELIPVVYPVGDLVLPIPNFIQGGAPMGTVLRQAMLGANSPLSGTPMATATPIGNGASDIPTVAHSVLAQMNGPVGAPGGAFASASSGMDAMGGFGPVGEVLNGAGGAANADFDSLMDLIRETIEPESWDDVGGPGSMEPFPLNLSLIISQTEEVHDRIASLLEQLRRLLDLQLAVEVRFITLTDNFFERIGIDFDFDIDDDQDKPFQVFGQPDPTFTPNYNFPSGQDPEADNPGRDYQDRDHLNGVAVGQSAPGIFSVDLDIPFRQNSFSLGVPTFGGFTNDAGAQIGFAILSDIEAFFFINAAQADRRTNVVQAPKVVMFNGQTGIVFDFVARPFLIGVIPIIGSGSVGFTPIIQPIPSGAIVAVTGIISADRRYVRLSVFPFFFQLGEVFTFTTNLGAVGGGGGLVGGGGAATTIPVTIQLPVVAFTSVFTTVNVPDGGTVLLGGVKRVNEGRTEAGVPVLNKLPYVNRLFKNVGTGRETQSLMLMVTPRIIIGEEEEELLGI